MATFMGQAGGAKLTAAPTRPRARAARAANAELLEMSCQLASQETGHTESGAAPTKSG